MTSGALLLGVCGATAARATDAWKGEPISVIDTSPDWARIELHEDPSPIFVHEPFADVSKRTRPEIVAAFGGDAEPPSSRFLLHCAPGWDRKDDARPPVVLVHGAVVDANGSWAANSFKGRGGDGLAARIASGGRRVFAITFAHPHGDNWLQSEVVADAIARVRTLTGADKVDLVAHSKGGVAARLYCSDLRKPGMTRFRGDVRRLLLLGAPNGGIDVAFAYPNLNYWVIANKSSAPLVWTEALCYGVWRDLKPLNLYAAPNGGGCFPGQAQMLARWDKVYGLYDSDPAQWDVKTTYEGGRGTVSVSLGIDAAIAAGGDLVATMEKAGIDRRVEVALLAGSKPAVLGFVGERRGPSDGLVLVRSALQSEGLAKAGAKIIRRDVLAVSHTELVYAEPAMRWIEATLGQ